ncbi:uncharacterized protein [Dysidea avara]|uniref:uncharacterized protein n=1 Tax=Dysidea avara TaxID=196820 RepID=UPI00332E5B3C
MLRNEQGPPDPPDQLALLSLSAYRAQVSWVQPFDGNDPVVVYHILVCNNDVNGQPAISKCHSHVTQSTTSQLPAISCDVGGHESITSLWRNNAGQPLQQVNVFLPNTLLPHMSQPLLSLLHVPHVSQPPLSLLWLLLHWWIGEIQQSSGTAAATSTITSTTPLVQSTAAAAATPTTTFATPLVQSTAAAATSTTTFTTPLVQSAAATSTTTFATPLVQSTAAATSTTTFATPLMQSTAAVAAATSTITSAVITVVTSAMTAVSSVVAATATTITAVTTAAIMPLVQPDQHQRIGQRLQVSVHPVRTKQSKKVYKLPPPQQSSCVGSFSGISATPTTTTTSTTQTTTTFSTMSHCSPSTMSHNVTSPPPITTSRIIQTPSKLPSITMTQSADSTIHTVPTTAEGTLSLVSSTPRSSTMASNKLQPVSLSPEDRLPDAWKSVLNKKEQQWIGTEVFFDKHKINDTAASKLWWDPPSPSVTKLQPDPESYILHKLCLWLPRRKWNFNFKCPSCQCSLSTKGIYTKSLRRIINLTDCYFLATEELNCKPCKRAYQCWDNLLLSQLP